MVIILMMIILMIAMRINIMIWYYCYYFCHLVSPAGSTTCSMLGEEHRPFTITIIYWSCLITTLGLPLCLPPFPSMFAWRHRQQGQLSLRRASGLANTAASKSQELARRGRWNGKQEISGHERIPTLQYWINLIKLISISGLINQWLRPTNTNNNVDKGWW